MADIERAGLKTREQQELNRLMQQSLTTGEGPLADVLGKFNEEQFGKEFERGVSQPLLKQFQEQVLPSVIEKYISRGQTGSAMRRGKFKAAGDFQNELAKLYYEGLQSGKTGAANRRLQGLLGLTGAQNFENIVTPEQDKGPSIGSTLLKTGLTAAGTAVGGIPGMIAANALAGAVDRATTSKSKQVVG